MTNSIEAHILANINSILESNEETRLEAQEQTQAEINRLSIPKQQRFNNAVGALMADGQAQQKARFTQNNPALAKWANPVKQSGS